MKRLIISLSVLVTLFAQPMLGFAQAAFNVAFNVSSTVQVGLVFTVTVSTTDAYSNAAATGPIVVEIKNTSGTITATKAVNSSPGQVNVDLGPINAEGIYTLQARISGNTYPGPQVTVGPASDPQTNPGSSTTTPATTQSSQKVELPNPIACNDATCLIGQVVRYILGSIAVVATLMFVWGGVMMMTSGGNADQVKRAKETLVWAAIGVVVILLSWVIIKAVLQALTKTSS